MSKRMGKIDKDFNWEEMLNLFLAEKKAQGRSQTTVNDYDYHVRQFYKRYPKGELKTNIYSYMSEDIAPGTYNLRLEYLRAFYSWCKENGYLLSNPLEALKKRRAEARIVSIDPQVLAVLIQLPDISTYAGLRDKALITLTLDCGIRPKEALSLLISDYNPKTLEIVIRAKNAKTRVQRILPISQVTSSLISRLISIRPRQWGMEVPIFASSDGTKLTRGSWEDRLKKYSNILGVKIRPYDLRHVFALEFLKNGGNALFLQKMMGHTDLSMTKRYVNATNEDLKVAHEEASPLTKLIRPKRVRNIK